jgi:hypothetical protein
VRCHQQGQIGPADFTRFDNTAAAHAAIASAVQARQMPPWKPAACCRNYRDDFSLTDAEIAMLAEWSAAGAPEGDAQTAIPVDASTGAGLPRVDLQVSMGEAYQPTLQEGSPDDTRCFLLDWPETETVYVTGMEVLPGNPAVVHHVMVLIAGPSDVNTLQRNDDAAEGPGWSCPGGLVSRYSGYLGGWSPGFEALALPEGLGHRVEAGSKLLLTVHYSLSVSGNANPDQTTLKLMFQTDATREVQALSVYDTRWVLGGMPVQKDKENVVYRFGYDPSTLMWQWKGYEIWAVNVHMHERGSKGMLAIQRADGSTECLLQIDDYDYHWQGDYYPSEPVRIAPGDKLYVECHFNNSADHQRVINGRPEEPRDLNWAENQEMCVGFATAVPVE